MKPYKIKKRETRVPSLSIDITPPPPPKIPLVFIKKIHKPEFFVEFVYEDEPLATLPNNL